MYTINSKTLSNALDRCVTVKDGYTITFTGRKVGNTKDVYAHISACTAHAISTICIDVTPSEEVGPTKVLVGPDFFDAVKAIAAVGSDIELELQQDIVLLSCGDAQIPVKLKTQVTNFTPKSPKHEEHALFTIDSKEWKRMIQQGGFAYGSFDEKGKQAAFNNIYLRPFENCVRICTFSGFYATSSSADIKEKVNEKYIDMVQASQGISLTPNIVKMITNELKNDTITVYIFDTQLLIKDGNDFFAMVLSNTNSMEKIFDILDEKGYSYCFKATTTDIKVAINIVSVNCSDLNHASMCLEINNNNVFVHSADNRNKASIKSEHVEGNVSIQISIKQLKEIISTGMSSEVDSVTIFGFAIGEGNHIPAIHINGGHCMAFTAPIATPTSDADTE